MIRPTDESSEHTKKQSVKLPKLETWEDSSGKLNSIKLPFPSPKLTALRKLNVNMKCILPKQYISINIVVFS